MTDQSDHETRWRLVRDVVVFQIKLGMEAVLDLTQNGLIFSALWLGKRQSHWRMPCCLRVSSARIRN